MRSKNTITRNVDDGEDLFISGEFSGSALDTVDVHYYDRQKAIILFFNDATDNNSISVHLSLRMAKELAELLTAKVNEAKENNREDMKL